LDGTPLDSCEPQFAETMKLRFERFDLGKTRRLDAPDLKFHHPKQNAAV